MSLISSLQNGQKTQLASNADVNINVGNGHSNISAKGKNVNIDTGCGDQNITVAASGDANIDTGHCGTDNINAVVGGNANITTREDDDNVTLICGGNFNIDVGEDHHECEERGYTFTDNDTVNVISTSTTGQNTISTGKDNDKIIVVANNVTVDKGEGSLLMGAIGNNYDVNSEATKNVIGFYGNDYNIDVTAERSKNDIRTLDFWLRDGEDGKKILMNDGTSMSLKDAVDDVQDSHDGAPMTLTQYDKKYNEENVKFFKDNFGDYFDKITYAGQQVTTEVSSDLVSHESVTKNNKDELAKKYNLSDEEKAILDKVDLTKTLAADGQPLYAIAKSPKKSSAGKDVYVVVKRDNVNHARAVSNNECIAFKASDASIYKETKTDTDVFKVTTTKIIEDLYNTTGIKNVSITQNRGNLNAFLSVSDGSANIKTDTACNNDQVRNITVVGGHTDSVVTKQTCENTEIKQTQSEHIGKILFSDGTWTSPLVLDTNKDGKVTSSNAAGVDVNNDGTADGAATRGDKMLAMSDFNKNGQIDGNEVFGDQTVSPFTGKKLNAANGFEALKMIANEAEQKTGYKIITNGNVDIAKLQEALASVGINLGLISNNNVTSLESASDIRYINVDNYIQNDKASGEVQHRQLGTYTDASGKIHSVNDVWYKTDK